jgi:antitoxin (DNA-binding transcriptional repressor) of toxin-antitoxin stability system
MKKQIGRSSFMREIAASEARTHLLQLLDEVERGETLVITRHGRPVARLTRENNERRAEIAVAVAALRSRRRQASSIEVDELLSARDEGRRA